ncbi:MAG: SpoIID/LytB domain-containing protein [Phycisphaerae bacterium]|nr:SpoIID/LytB domain-containing protein [Phycisphaerae bacterium]
MFPRPTTARLRRSRATGPQAAAPIAVLAAGTMLVASLVASCARQRLVSQHPLRMSGVPTIRVRLTSQPISIATLTSSSGYRLWADGRVVSESAAAMPDTTVRRRGEHWLFNSLEVEGRQAMLEPLDGMLRAGRTFYRGRLHLLAEGDQFILVNHLDLESYLAGVLAKELYPYWSPTTYRALAIAARTFALYHIKTTGVGRDFDVGDDQASQVYGGASAETEKAWQAVQATHGQVLTFGLSGQERIFMAQYSACCGGTVNAASVIRDAPGIAPLEGGQACTDCRYCPRYRWGPVRVAKNDIYRAAAAAYPAVTSLGSLASIKTVAVTAYDRPVWLDLVGANGRSVRLRAEDLRLALLRGGAGGSRQLNSMNCRIVDAGGAVEFTDGRGFGHGVGLCQWGAQAKADQGWTAEEILGFYYPGATILSAY